MNFFNRNLLIAFAFMGVETLPCHAGGIVGNGSFEQENNGSPVVWNGGDNGAKCSMRITPAQAVDGKKSLFIRNECAAAGKYGNLRQKVKLLPGIPYELSCLVKGDANGKILLAVGNGWNQRLVLDSLGPKWEKRNMNFTLSETEVGPDGADLVIISEGLARGVYLDQVEISTEKCIYTKEEADKLGLPLNLDMEKSVLKYHFDCADLRTKDKLDFTLTVRDFPQHAPLSLELRSQGRVIAEQPLWMPEKVAEKAVFSRKITLPLDKLPPETPYQLVLRSGSDSAEILDTSKVDAFTYYRNQLSALEQRRQNIEKQVQTLPPEKLKSGYLTLYRRVLGDFLPPLLQYFNETDPKDESRKQFLVDQRARMMLPATTEAMDEFEKAVKTLSSGGLLPEAWQLNSEKIELLKGWPCGEIKSDRGNTAKRQVVFTGYGHFASVNLQNDIPNLNAYAANIIQIEIGPSAIIQQPEPGKPEFSNLNWVQFDDQILRSLKLARENNIKVCLLISPHYIPGWWMNRHPEVIRSGRGFGNIEINHPLSRELFAAHIDTLTNKVKNSPYADVIHSFCITNEPQYGVSPEDAYTREKFQEYIIRKYGSLEKFNQTAKRRYADFKALFADANDTAVKYELAMYRSDTFTEFHRFLIERIHKNWPGVPCQSKQIPFHFFNDLGDNFEDIGALSDYNGNDNATHIWNGKTDCHSLSCIQEMQISFNPGKSIANMENHIICDRDTGDIPNSHIYMAIFHPIFTGASTQITWVWVDLHPNNRNGGLSTDFIGNIRLRPGNIIAQGKAHLDAMRLAPELSAFTAFRPKVAILSSYTSAQLLGELYKKCVSGTYFAATYFAREAIGSRIGFLSEKQLQREDWGDCKVLLVSGAAYLQQETYKKLAAFVRRGGTIHVDALSLKNDQFGNPVKINFPVKEVFAFNNKNLKAIVDHADPSPISATSSDKNGMDQICFRTLKQGKDCLVYIANLNHAPRRITLKSTIPFRYTELIREQTDWPSSFELRQNEIILLRAAN